MKKWIVVFILSVVCCMNACSNGDAKNPSNDDSVNEVSKKSDSNRVMLAEILGVEESSRNIHFILNCLNTIQAGQIQSAEYAEVNGNVVINIVAENGTSYQIHLAKGGNPDAVKNLDTGEWVLKSTR